MTKINNHFCEHGTRHSLDNKPMRVDSPPLKQVNVVEFSYFDLDLDGSL